jgi:DNA-nicking Smr family endonuclease
MSKVKQINLEQGHPTVEEAVRRMKNDLATAKMSGCKAAILIHGYGSTGSGGAIKPAVCKNLSQPVLVGIVKDWVAGENWSSKKAVFLANCPSLKEHARHIDGNLGITVVLLK